VLATHHDEDVPSYVRKGLLLRRGHTPKVERV